VLRLIRRRGILLPFCLGGGSGCEDVLSEIALLDKIFKVLTERPTLRSSMSFVGMNSSLSLRYERVVCFCVLTPHPGLTLNGLEYVLDWELQRDEAVRYLIGSELVPAEGAGMVAS